MKNLTQYIKWYDHLQRF